MGVYFTLGSAIAPLDARQRTDLPHEQVQRHHRTSHQTIVKENMTRILCVLATCGLILGGCAQKATKAKLDTPASKLRSIAYMPYFGVPVDPILQHQLSGYWANWWNDVYPGTTWLQATPTTERLLKADVLRQWSDAEKTFMQTGVLTSESITRLCDALGTQGFLQGAVYSAEAGIAASSMLSIFRSTGKPSSARMSFTLYDCGLKDQVWRAAEELNYESGYSHAKMIEYVHGVLAGKI